MKFILSCTNNSGSFHTEHERTSCSERSSFSLVQGVKTMRLVLFFLNLKWTQLEKSLNDTAMYTLDCWLTDMLNHTTSTYMYRGTSVPNTCWWFTNRTIRYFPQKSELQCVWPSFTKCLTLFTGAFSIISDRWLIITRQQAFQTKSDTKINVTVALSICLPGLSKLFSFIIASNCALNQIYHLTNAGCLRLIDV